MNDKAKRPMFRAWLVVGVLWMVAVLNYLDRLTITTMRESVKADIVMTDEQFGLLTSVFLWVYAALSPFAGYLADRFGRSRVIVISLLGWSLVTWLMGQCRTVNELLIVRGLLGVSEACYIPAALALITDYHHGPTRSFATGLHMTGIHTGTIVSGFGGYVAMHWGWRMGFSFLGLFGIVYAAMLMFVLRDVPRASTPEDPESGVPVPHVALTSTLGALLKLSSYYAILVYWSVLALAGWGIVGWLPTYLSEHFDLGQGAAGVSATVYNQVGCFVGILVGGAWADAWTRTNIRGRILVPVIGFVIAGPALFLAASTDVLVVAVAGLLVYGVSRGFCDANMMPILCQVANPRHRATGYGLMNCCSCMVGGVMIYVGGVLKDRDVDLSVIFKFAAGGLLLAAALLFLVRPRRDLEAR